MSNLVYARCDKCKLMDDTVPFEDSRVCLECFEKETIFLHDYVVDAESVNWEKARKLYEKLKKGDAMKKIKVFADGNTSTLQDEINVWQEKTRAIIHDVKISTSAAPGPNEDSIKGVLFVCVIYE